MALRKYASDPSIRAMMGSVQGVRFTGTIIEKSDDGKTVVMQVELPGQDGYVRAEVKMIPSRFKRVSLFDTAAGLGQFERKYVEGTEKAVENFKPGVFAVRNSYGVQVA